MTQQTHLTPKQLAERLQIKERTLAAWRYLRIGPAYMRTGRVIRYAIADVDRWVEEQKK